MALDRCTGAGGSAGHCCYLNGVVCPFLVEFVGGRRYACGIRLRHRTWRGAVADPEYRSVVAPVWISLGLRADYCRTWQPSAGQCCREAA